MARLLFDIELTDIDERSDTITGVMHVYHPDSKDPTLSTKFHHVLELPFESRPGTLSFTRPVVRDRRFKLVHRDISRCDTKLFDHIKTLINVYCAGIRREEVNVWKIRE